LGKDAARECQGAKGQGKGFHSDNGLHACGSPMNRQNDVSCSDWNGYRNTCEWLRPAYSPGCVGTLSLRVCPREAVNKSGGCTIIARFILCPATPRSGASQENSRESSAARFAAARMASRTVPAKSF